MQGKWSLLTVICVAQGLCINSQQLAFTEPVESLYSVNKIVMQRSGLIPEIMGIGCHQSAPHGVKNNAQETNQDDPLYIPQYPSNRLAHA
jgi:hypothetical protein